MGASLLAKTFPVDDKVTPITTPEDVVSLAHDFLKQDGINDILNRVGEHGDFTDEEQVFVHKALIAAGERFKTPGHHWDNLNIAIALARKLVSGSIQEEDIAACLTFVEDKLRIFQFFLGSTVEGKPILMSEVLQFLRNLKKRDDILEPFLQYREMEKGSKRDELWEKIRNSVRTFGLVEGWKYGLANRKVLSLEKLGSVVNAYYLGRIPSLEEKVVLAELRRKHMKLQIHTLLADDLAGEE